MPVKIQAIWILSRGEWTELRRRPGAETVGDNDKVPERDSKVIADAWLDLHNLILPGNLMLIENQKCKLWKEATSDPQQIEQ